MGSIKQGWIWAALTAGCAAWLAGCAPVQETAKVDNNAVQLVYPSPPDPPRFVFERSIWSSNDIQGLRTSASAMRQAFTGESVQAEGLNKPYAVAVHRGRIFVSDADRFVKVFDVPAQRFYKIGDDPQGSIVKPLGLDVDGEGNVYVADATAKVVLVYDGQGKFLRKIGGPKMFDRLSSVTVDQARRRLFVVDIGGVGSDQHRVRVFDTFTGAHLFDIGKRGVGPGEFNLPRDVAIGKNGQIYVVDGGNFRVQIFDANGKYLQSFGSVGKQVGNFARPKEIAADADGNVYVVDAAFGNFQIFNAEGDILMFVGDRGENDIPGRYMLPSGIAVDEDGRVYMVDQWFKRIDIFRPYGLAEKAGYLASRPEAPAKPR
jgi:DNA-binding beta-propeller fold protein YncE